MANMDCLLLAGSIAVFMWTLACTQGYFLPRARDLYGLRGVDHHGKSVCDFGVYSGRVVAFMMLAQCYFVYKHSDFFFRYVAPLFLLTCIGLAYVLNKCLFEWLIPAFVLESIIILFAFKNQTELAGSERESKFDGG